MALKLNLRPGEKIVINGAVIVNGDRKASLAVKNFAHILRESDVMQEEAATTPTRRTYFVAQLMLLDPDNAARYSGNYLTMLEDLLRVYSNAEVLSLLKETTDYLERRDYYKILANLRKVIRYEDLLLAGVKVQTLPDDFDGGVRQ